jgi:hypothetical protein
LFGRSEKVLLFDGRDLAVIRKIFATDTGEMLLAHGHLDDVLGVVTVFESGGWNVTVFDNWSGLVG